MAWLTFKPCNLFLSTPIDEASKIIFLMLDRKHFDIRFLMKTGSSVVSSFLKIFCSFIKVPNVPDEAYLIPLFSRIWLKKLRVVVFPFVPVMKRLLKYEWSIWKYSSIHFKYELLRSFILVAFGKSIFSLLSRKICLTRFTCSFVRYFAPPLKDKKISFFLKYFEFVTRFSFELRFKKGFFIGILTSS